MRWLLVVLIGLLFPSLSAAAVSLSEKDWQTLKTIARGGGVGANITLGTTLPVTCTPGGANALFLDTDDEELFYCKATNMFASVTDIEADTLLSVTGRGNTSTGNDETNPFQIFGTGANAGIGHEFIVTSGGDFVYRCLAAAGANKCNKITQVDDTFTAGWKDKDSAERFIFDGTTGAITKMTVDHTSADVAVTRKIVVPIKLASCQSGTAAGALDRPGNGATVPTPTCLDAGSVEAPHLAFSGTAVNSGSFTIPIPPQFTSLTSMNITVRYATASASPTGNVQWDFSTVCRAVGETIDGSFNSAQNVVDAVAAQNVKNDATQIAATITGCAPNEDLTLLVSRNGASGSDTNNDVAMAFYLIFEFIGVE